MIFYKESKLSRTDHILNNKDESDSISDCSFSDENNVDNFTKIVDIFSSREAPDISEIEKLVWSLSSDLCDESVSDSQLGLLFNSNVVDKITEIILDSSVPTSARVGSVYLLSKLVRYGSERLYSTLLERELLPVIYNLMDCCTIAHHVARILDFFSELAGVDERMNAVVLNYFGIDYVLEKILDYNNSSMISKCYCQLLGNIALYRLSNDTTIKIINFIKYIVNNIKDSFIWEKCSEMLYNFCELDCIFKEQLKDEDTYDLISKLLKKGNPKTIKYIVHLIMLLMDYFDLSYLNFNLILSRLSNINSKASKHYFTLIRYIIESSEELSYMLIKCKLFDILMKNFQESSIEIKGYSLKILISLVERCGANLLNQIVKKGFVLEFVHLFELYNNDISRDLLFIFQRLFSDCNDSGILILLKQQFIENDGINYLESISNCIDDKELSCNSIVLLKLIDSIKTDEFDDNGKYLFDSDNDDI